ncbi:coagulation factor 5/8 type domain-containing protein [Actinacidiphila bryophytorum]|uniref:coagulation factor 5/8 type domain-containing protein n=1 Tax=Actinacidiphila bryophytorum TaxID=1436133 RepID=UPI002176EE13|nr:coagulation factor 5/8 type domain-containing protein [Actinacidiphila bryophytorum]UWE09872.1 coagulation factor 5/8 type domain-containing protein [Actinacidiphila bryophytorum]
MSSFRAAGSELTDQETQDAPADSALSRRSFIATAALASAVPLGAAAAPASARGGHGRPPAPAEPDFGPNVRVFDPATPAADIQAALNAAAQQQVTSEFGTGRFAFLFKPGTYDVDAQLGYYTSVAGLGLSPDDVTINGAVRVEGQPQPGGGDSALTNFWRSAENLAVVPADGINWWAVSQAAPLRRVHIRGQLFLFPRQGGFSSGGFIADSVVDGQVVNASQQQWLTRDSAVGGWSNGVWNQVFSGVAGAPEQSFPDPPYTTLPTTPVSREKPFLYVDATGRYRVFLPALRRESAGASWSAGHTPGSSIPIEQFFVAKPSDSVRTINKALAQGKHLLLTPGIYRLTGTIKVKWAGTVVLGLGFATLTPVSGAVAMRVDDVRGVRIAGLLFDAGETESRSLLEIGGGHGRRSDPQNPTSVQDVFFRVGGAGPGRTGTALVVNSDNVLLDHIWAWRADHGSGVGWTVNTAESGVVVNGDNVLATGLFVEHFQKYNVVWNGEHGRTVMFQNELPYDPPNQAAYRHHGVDGWAAYKVGDAVRHHEAWGLGSYCFFTVDPTIHVTRSFEAPARKDVRFHDLLTVSLNGAGVIDHVINDYGAAAQGTATVPVDVVGYPAG